MANTLIVTPSITRREQLNDHLSSYKNATSLMFNCSYWCLATLKINSHSSSNPQKDRKAMYQYFRMIFVFLSIWRWLYCCQPSLSLFFGDHSVPIARGILESSCQGHSSKEGEGTGTARRNWQVPVDMGWETAFIGLFKYFYWRTAHIYIYIWGFPSMGAPQNGWFIVEDDLGVPPIYGNPHIYI